LPSSLAKKAGFVKNVFQSEEKNGKIILQPTIYKNIAIYGYPGRKSGLEVQDIERISIQDSPGLFRILMLHTTLKDAIGTLPIPAVDPENLPKVDYLALAHLHLKYHKENRVYCGPTFPNNAAELEELKGGSFYIIETSGKIERHEINLKEVIKLDIEINDSLIGTEKIIQELEKHNLKDKILILKLKGILENGKVSDIDFKKIEIYLREKEVYTFLKNTTKLQAVEPEIKIEVQSEDIEEEILSKFQKENPNKFNNLISQLFSFLQTEKKEEERSRIFEERLTSEFKKIIEI